MPRPGLPSAQVRRHVLAAIANGSLKPGATCPSDRQLAEQLGVSRVTVQSALQALLREGVLDRRGRCRIVADGNAATRTGGAGSLWPGTVAIIAPNSGLLIPDEAARGWWQHLLHGAQGAIHHAGLHALVLHQARLRRGDLERILRPPPHGLLLLEPVMIEALSRQTVQAIVGRKLAAVVAGDEPGQESFDRVVSDHARGAAMLVERLVAHGRRRIVAISEGGTQPAWAQERQRGYLTAMAAAGLPARQAIPLPFADATADDPSLHRLIGLLATRLRDALVGPGGADALLAPSDGQALMINAAVRRLGLVPGIDVCVTGYDAYWWQAPTRAFCPDPPWATIDKGNQQLGVACVDLLLARIAGTLPAAPQRRMIAPRGILSGTIGPGQSPAA